MYTEIYDTLCISCMFIEVKSYIKFIFYMYINISQQYKF